MRTAHLVCPWLLALSTATPWVMAQTPPTTTPPAAEATAPQRALVHTPLPTSGTVIATLQDWRAANTAVGELPRGHADVLRWEAAQQPAPPATTSAVPAAQPHACPMMAQMPSMHLAQPPGATATMPAPAAAPAHHEHGGQP